ncbi:MAG: hypothetical protein AB4062_05550 [Crocosphaera sp.]
MELAEKFVTDAQGNRIGVLLSIEDYQKLLDALETLKSVETDDNAIMSKKEEITSPKMRPTGLCEGEFIVPDDFDDPLPEEILQGFESRKKVNRFWDSLQTFRQSQDFKVCNFDEDIFTDLRDKSTGRIVDL